MLIFTCENCGKRFKIDERLQGKRGRCSHCGHKMKIPRIKVAEDASAPTGGSPVAEDAAPFRLSPPESRPVAPDSIPAPSSLSPAHQPVEADLSIFQLEPHGAGPRQPPPHDDHVQFDLIDDDEDDPADDAQLSPAVKRGLREIAEFEKDPRGYTLDGDRSGVFSFLGMHELGPASWLYTKWRAGVNTVLRLFRWVDTWAYLISVPFLILMIFGIVIQNAQFVHTGAVVVVLANYGRFWADLLALFVRPYKDGPLHGLLFLFPPYTLYYLGTRWQAMKKIVRRIAYSCIPIILVLLLYGFLPSINPEARDVQGFGAKLQAGKDELDKDIKTELNLLENKVIGVGKPPDEPAKQPAPTPEVPAKPRSKPQKDISPPPI